MASKTPLAMPPREELIELYEEKHLSFKQLSEILGVSTGTLSKWFRLYEIKTGHRMPTRVRLKIIRGIKHRRCYGPNHHGSWVPISKFRKHQGKPFGIETRCRRCDNPNARVDFTPSYQGWLTSIYRRVGFSESCRRLGISQRTMEKWMKSPPLQIRRNNAESIIRVLSELRTTGEVRHRKSIRRGATARGEIERKVQNPSDLLHRSTGDSDTEYKRQYRRRKKAEVAA
jgi:hypothetical protein